VTPALFLAGFSLRSASIQRVFAILELLRAVAAFMIVPILLHFATTLTGLATPAINTALWICFGLSAGAGVVGIGLYLLGRVRPPAPALERWMGGQEPAWDSPPLLAALRHRAAPGEAVSLAPALAGGDGSSRLKAAPIGSARPGPIHRRADVGPVLFAYDGSDQAKAAIVEAGHQLPRRREALVLTVWRTFNVGFTPEPDAQFDAACGDDVRQAAEQTAARGAALADAAGFRAQPLAVEGTPAWKAVIVAAKEYDASLIVLGSHRRAGLGGLVAGSVAGDVTARSSRPVLIIRDHGAADGHAAAETSPLAGAASGSATDVQS
jgi:nucleotide-binding universal stress UspA family protein